VEVACTAGDGRAVRDSKNRADGIQFYTASQWAVFVAGVKTGRFEI
jgi:hypothetical protein